MKERAQSLQERSQRLQTIIREREDFPHRVTSGNGPYRIEGVAVFEGTDIKSDIAIGDKRDQTIQNVKRHTESVLTPRLSGIQTAIQEEETAAFREDFEALTARYERGLVKPEVYNQYREKLQMIESSSVETAVTEHGSDVQVLQTDDEVTIPEAQPKSISIREETTLTPDIEEDTTLPLLEIDAEQQVIKLAEREVKLRGKISWSVFHSLSQQGDRGLSLD